MMGDHIIVTERCKNMRALARQALRGNWRKSALTVLVFHLALAIPIFVVSFIIGFLVIGLSGLYDADDSLEYFYSLTALSVQILVPLLAAGPLTLGFSTFMIGLFRRTGCEISQLFSGFRQFAKAFGLYFMRGLFIVLWALPVIIAMVIITAITLLPGDPPELLVSVFPLLFMIALYAIVIFMCLRYSQVFYILADDPNKGIMQCIKESKLLMKGNIGKLFLLHLSFIGWVALLTLVCLIGVGTLSVTMAVGDVIILPALLMIFVYIAALFGSIVIEAYARTTMVAFYDILTGRLQANSAEEVAQTKSYQSIESRGPER